MEYGPTTAYGSSTTLNSSLVVAHSQTLERPGARARSYHYRVKSRDAAGNQTVSGDFTFTTLAGPDQGLIAYLKFDEGSGHHDRGRFRERQCGHAWSTGPAGPPGVSGQAAVLDGVDDYVSIPHAAASRRVSR